MISSEQNPAESRQSTFLKLATAASFACLLAYAVVFTITPAAINEIGREYSASTTQLGWLFRMMMSGFFVAVLLSGRYSDRKGRLPTLLVGSVLMGMGLLLFAGARDFRMAVAALLLAGIGGGCSEGTAMALVSDLYSGSRRTAVLNVSQAAFAVGAVAAPLSIGWLIRAHIDWRIGYLAAAVFCAVSFGIVVAAMLMRLEKPQSDGQGTGKWQTVMRDPLVLWLSFAMFLYVGAENGPAAWLAAFLEKDLHALASVAAYSVAVFWGGIFAGRVAGIFASRLHSDVTIIRIALLSAIVVQVAMLLIQAPSAGLVAAFCLGFFNAPVFPTIASLAGSAHPTQSGTVLGIVVACGSLGAAIVPPLVGWLADLIGMRYAIGSCIIILAANLLIFLAVRRVTRLQS